MVHPVLREWVEEFGFRDLMLISGSGQIVYTVAKQVDFGTNIIDGPFQDSNLADVFSSGTIQLRGSRGEARRFRPLRAVLR